MFLGFDCKELLLRKTQLPEADAVSVLKVPMEQMHSRRVILVTKTFSIESEQNRTPLTAIFFSTH